MSNNYKNVKNYLFSSIQFKRMITKLRKSYSYVLKLIKNMFSLEKMYDEARNTISSTQLQSPDLFGGKIGKQLFEFVWNCFKNCLKLADNFHFFIVCICICLVHYF